MAGQVLTQNGYEREFFLELMDEFAPKVQTSRLRKTEWADKFGITKADADVFSDDIIYDVALPLNYVNFINYLIDQKRQ